MDEVFTEVMPILNSRSQTQTSDGKTIPSAEVLAHAGPIIPVTLAVPDRFLQAYANRGETAPAAVSGLALIDTGSEKTCFDNDAARAAGLPTLGVAKMSSASHFDQTVSTFSGKIVCPTMNIEVEGALGSNLAKRGNKLIVLLGRDVLRSAILTYNGPEGQFSLAI